ncbi:MAG: PolC-type DNA polymerase III [Ureaplasma sp.]|nr:PolC-type DNA polymerase III [Ureaplasma sp.]
MCSFIIPFGLIWYFIIHFFILINFIFSEKIEKTIEEQNKKIIQEQIELRKSNLMDSSIKSNTDQNKYKFKYQGYDEINICDACLENPKAKIKGKIFHIEVNENPKQCNIIKMGVADETGAVYIRQIINKEATKEYLNNYSIDSYIQATVEFEINKFDVSKEISGHVKNIELLPKKTRKDNSEIKRVEFVTHTKMSSYDGIIENNELKKALEEFGYQRFAITDRSNVQIYPEIEKTFKKSNVSPIYGVEIELLEKEILGVLNSNNTQLEELYPLVIFDLETTGLYPNFDEIIEFGAVKIHKNKKIEKLDFFMKPSKPISEFTQNLTGISNNDLKDAISEYEGLQKIINFVEDCPLVAHNGINFDFKFLQTKLVSYGFKELTNPMIDTLIISRTLNELMYSHTLEKVSRRYKVNYNPDEAHRADYDAEVLYYVWLKMIDEFENREIKTLSELDNYLRQNSNHKASRGYIINLYAKNQNGIKDLYELISIAHTKNFAGRPVLYWEDILNKKTNILVANNPIESDLINSLMTENDLLIKEQINKYDFILVPTPLQFQHEIDIGNFSIKAVEIIIKKLIDFSIELNKLPVVTSNVYYLEKSHEKYHQMFVNTPILNKKPHRFAKFKKGPLAYLRTANELKSELEFLNDEKLLDDIVIQNTLKIADLISNDIVITRPELFAPVIDGVNEKVTNEVYKNARMMYGEQLPEIVENRIKKELNSIISHNYAVVYWVSHLLVKKSIEDGYVVGSRGSVGSSIVATFLNITDVNPLEPHYLCKNCKYSEFDHNEVNDGYDLKPKNCPKCNKMIWGEGHNIPFETFLGFKGDKVPDIDLNFSGLYQNKAHEFIKNMFGEDKAFRAGTISTIAEKSSFAHARDYFNRLGYEEVKTAQIQEYAKKCQDVKRTTGQHPGGIVVVPESMSIFDFTPYNYPADDTEQDWKTTHFAFEYIHDNLLKFDILGHDNPTILKILKDLTGIDSNDIPNYDENTLRVFTDISVLKINPEDIFNETTGSITLPEFGTKFVREMLKSANPKSFGDLICVSGLSHGTDVWIDNAQSLINSGKTLQEVIACRDDIMIYLIDKGIEPSIAFKVMEDVRKGKRINPEHQKILEENNIPEWYINSANKIKYMFPKAHATAYVLHAWKFAWYKLYYPLAYYASFFTVRTNVFDVQTITGSITEIRNKMNEIKTKMNSRNLMHSLTTKEKDLYPIYEVALEAKLRGINILNIDLKKSKAIDFIIDNETNTIICPFVCLDGLGDVVAKSIADARDEKEFVSIEDFISRTKVTKQHLEKFKSLGILKDLDETDQLSLF